MGFACSPLWCNIYFLFYEWQFIIRLAKLGRTQIMNIFIFATRYVDDIVGLMLGIQTYFWT